MKEPVALLHLTDLHFTDAGDGHFWNSFQMDRPAHDRVTLIQSLSEDCKRLLVRPSVVVVTGDLLDKASSNGIGRAIEFLNAVSSTFCIPRERIVLTPGNHDVRWVGAIPEHERYSHFVEIWNGFYGPARAPISVRTEAYKRVEVFDMSAEVGLQVISFNSCERLAVGQEHGSIGLGQRTFAEALFGKTKSTMRVAVFHHHIAKYAGVMRDDYSVMDDEVLTREWLVSNEFDMALHGHQHCDVSQDFVIDGRHLSVAGGASAGVGRYGREHWDLRLGYQVIGINSRSRGVRFRREFDVQKGRWVDAAGGATQDLHFGSMADQMRPSSSGSNPQPSKPEVRRLLGAMFPSAAEFDAFCSDHFEDTFRQFAAGMSRVERETLLLVREGGRVVEVLRRDYSALFLEHFQP